MDDQAGLAIAELRAENARLRSALNEQAGSRARIVSASDDELRRIERNLHDGAQQRLVTLALRLRQIGDQADGQDGLEQMIRDAREELALATEELRELARGLHPAILTTDGLPGGLEDLAVRSPLPVELVCPEQRYPEEIEATAYFLVSEALTNAAKHARASLAQVSVSCRDGVLRIEITDDGAGGANASGRGGLLGLVDRVAAVGGTLWIDSPPGAGTSLTAELPCEPTGAGRP